MNTATYTPPTIAQYAHAVALAVRMALHREGIRIRMDDPAALLNVNPAVAVDDVTAIYPFEVATYPDGLWYDAILTVEFVGQSLGQRRPDSAVRASLTVRRRQPVHAPEFTASQTYLRSGSTIHSDLDGAAARIARMAAVSIDR